MEKTNLQAIVRNMETRLAAKKSSPSKGSQSTTVPTADQVPATNTNQNNGAAGKP